MISNLKIHKRYFFLFALMAISLSVFSQNDSSVFKAQFGLGVNSPFENGFVTDFEAKTINAPTVFFGIQYMFKPRFGAKLDYSFSRMSNKTSTREFQLNYSRINAQLIYDAGDIFNSLPQRLGIFTHIGPGISIVKPLGNYTDNDISFFNANAGIELHYGISRNLSLFTDLAYTHSFSDDFFPISTGYGSFNGSLVTLTVGMSISLSGCYFCERRYD